MGMRDSVMRKGVRRFFFRRFTMPASMRAFWRSSKEFPRLRAAGFAEGTEEGRKMGC